MEDRTIVDPICLKVNTMTRHHLVEALQERGVQLNESAVTLLDNPVFDSVGPEPVTVVERSVDDLGLVTGAVLPRIYEAALESGLQLCPPTLAPYLRLALRFQETAPDAVMSNGQAPTGSLTVAAPPLSGDSDYPKGFYLRVINGHNWLRGYRCSTEHVWEPGDRFVFRSSSR